MHKVAALISAAGSTVRVNRALFFKKMLQRLRKHYDNHHLFIFNPLFPACCGSLRSPHPRNPAISLRMYLGTALLLAALARVLASLGPATPNNMNKAL